MIRKLLCIPVFFFCLSASVPAADPQQETSRSFTNKDLEQYRSEPNPQVPPAADISAVTINQKGGKKEKPHVGLDKKEQDYWCRKATQINKKIAKDKEKTGELTVRLTEISEAESHVLGAQRTKLSKQRAKTEKDLKTAGKHLKERQGELAAIEDEAHRKGVPPGWLRCQFE